MPKLKLRPWKFPFGTRALLYRISSPYRLPNGNWTVRAFFHVSGSQNLEIIDFPWGTLPALQVGWYYIDGAAVEPASNTIAENLFIPRLNEGKIIKALNISGRFYNSRLIADKKLNQKDENIWRYPIDGKTYFMPCLELLRAFLLPSKTLTNLILRPNGLESVIEDERISDDTLEIYINKEFPSRLITRQNIAHLVWLLYNSAVKKSWDSVYRNIFAKSLEQPALNPIMAMAEGLTVEFEPPDIGSCLINVSAISDNSEYLINRINGFSLEDFPFKTIIYSHPSIKEKKIFKSLTKRYRSNVGSSEDGLFLDEERREPGHSFDHAVTSMGIVYFNFNFASNLIKLPQGQALIPVKDSEGGEDSESPHKTKQGVSVDEPVYGGQIQPVEFSALHVSFKKKESEFNDFFEALLIIKTKNPQMEIDFTIIDILGDKNFCFVYERKRRCAVIKISRGNLAPCFVFEIARPDGWLISTLFIRFRLSELQNDNLHKDVAKVLFNIVSENGHWSLDKFRAFSLQPIFLKHLSKQNTYKWAKRITEKLNEFEFDLI